MIIISWKFHLNWITTESLQYVVKQYQGNRIPHPKQRRGIYKFDFRLNGAHLKYSHQIVKCIKHIRWCRYLWSGYTGLQHFLRLAPYVAKLDNWAPVYDPIALVYHRTGVATQINCSRTCVKIKLHLGNKYYVGPANDWQMFCGQDFGVAFP